MKLNFDLEHCYGIKKLKTDSSIDFNYNSTVLIYAANGVMKTSFAKTMKDIQEGNETKDLIYPDNVTKRLINDENGNDIDPGLIFVIERYQEEFKSDKVATLLGNDKRKEYEKLYNKLDEIKGVFIKSLKTLSKSSDCEKELIETFGSENSDSVFEILDSLRSLLVDDPEIFSFKYNSVFDNKGKIANFLEKHSSHLGQYIEQYNNIIGSSTFFKKNTGNIFGTHQAKEILKSLGAGSYFDSGHSMVLSDESPINSKDELQSRLETEIDRIVSDKELKKIFDKIDKGIGANPELRAFKKVIDDNNLLLIRLVNYDEFKKDVWISYLSQLKAELITVSDEYNRIKETLANMIKESKDSITDWEQAVEVFNSRFLNLPFSLRIVNKEDVILKSDVPAIGFVFGEKKEVDKKLLYDVLSQGERRALYILNIIFEIEGRKKENQSTLFVIDDLADSFDYKNKYAIIEYLKDVSENPIFKQIILTHNFDFFRSIQSKIIRYSGIKNSFICVKNTNGIHLECIEKLGLIKPFENRKTKSLNNNLPEQNLYLVSLIPFVRNLIEYIKGDMSEEYYHLTHLLHIKTQKTYQDISNPIPDSNAIKFSDLQNIYSLIIPGIDLSNNNDLVLSSIYGIADAICDPTTQIEYLNLENKIVLSVAIRLKAEENIILELNDENFVNEITSRQTVKLVNEYKQRFEGIQNKKEKIKLFDKVNLVSSDNIHLNSFMYEPILDISDDHLIDIYNKL